MAALNGYDVEYDSGCSLLRCRVEASFKDEHLPAFLQELEAATRRARAAGPMRVLWDNRPARAVSPDIAAAIRCLMVDEGQDDERVAILVPNSHSKARGRAQMTPTVEMFLSESAALTWLSVGTDTSRSETSSGNIERGIHL